MVSDPASRRTALDLTFTEWTEWFAALGQPLYRARQLWQWLHVHGSGDPQEMLNLPAGLRDELVQGFDWQPLALATRRASADDSLKAAFRTRRGHPVEVVWMPGGAGGNAVCLSSHSGCGLGCQFCQTGIMGQLETLSAGQILAQLYAAEQLAGLRAERVVLMGMGEPLLNISAVRQVVAVLTDRQARGWAPKRVTVSTVGLVKPLQILARTFPSVNLALSLHFTQPEQRRRYMPNAEPELEHLTYALQEYREVNGGKLTIEYLMLAGINHGEADAKQLAWFTRAITDGTSSRWPGRNQPIVINLLTYNPIADANFKPVTEHQLNQFARQLTSLGLTVTIRRSRGSDINAACGQLGSELRGS